jgi:hypothetical protein
MDPKVLKKIDLWRESSTFVGNSMKRIP